MADISKMSTFPPILRSYHSGIFTSSEPFRPLHAARSPAKPPKAIDEQDAAHPESTLNQAQRKRAQRSDEAKQQHHPDTSSGLLSTDKIKRENELELRRKRNQKAEATLMCWDALMEEHRSQKYQTLQERVGIQRDLINKNDQLSTELKRRDEEERLGKIQARKLAQKKMAESLRSHIKRIEEHKKKIAEKLNKLRSTEQLGDDNSDIMDHTHSEDDFGIATGDSGQAQEESGGQEIEGAQNDVSTMVYRMLGCDSSKPDTRAVLESLWGGKKTATKRQLRPIIQYSNQLKEEASPSIKQCLEVYERPTAHDRYTGKPIPLGDILNDIMTKAEMGTNHSNWNNAIQLMSKHLQKRAQALLSRKDPYNQLDPTLSCNEGWFNNLCIKEEKEEEDKVCARTRAASCFATAGYTEKRKEKSPLLPKRAKSCLTTSQLKRKLPTFLSSDGDLISGSLEEFGSQLFCGPSRQTGGDREGEGRQNAIGGSVFLTDLQSDSADNLTSELKPAETGKGDRESEKSSKLRTKSLGWQPLSINALSQHSSVTELPVRGPGHKAHGKYSMWKPGQSCAV